MKKLSVSLSGHLTSISLESEFIDALHELARAQNKSIASIIAHIDDNRTPDTNLSAAIRVWILQQYKSVMNFGKIAARMFCNALLANAMDDSVAGGANSAPCDFIKDINSSQFIFCYSIERFIPICAAI